MRMIYVALCRPGSDLLSRALRQSTIGAGAFHGRVRNGNGCSHPARTTRSAKRNVNLQGLNPVEKLEGLSPFFLLNRIRRLEHIRSEAPQGQRPSPDFSGGPSGAQRSKTATASG